MLREKDEVKYRRYFCDTSYQKCFKCNRSAGDMFWKARLALLKGERRSAYHAFSSRQNDFWNVIISGNAENDALK